MTKNLMHLCVAAAPTTPSQEREAWKALPQRSNFYIKTEGRLEKGNSWTEALCPVLILTANKAPTGVTRLDVQNLWPRYWTSHRCDGTECSSDCSRGEV